MAAIRALLAGESWVSNSTHFKGWDFFSSTVANGHRLSAGDERGRCVAFTHMPGHLAAGEFPLDMTGLNRYDVVILSDLGANTPLLHPDTRLRGKTIPIACGCLPSGWQPAAR